MSSCPELETLADLLSREMAMNTRMALAIGALAAVSTLVGCARERALTSPTNPGVAAEPIASIEDSAVDVLESQVGYLSRREPERASAEGIEQAVRSADGLAFIVLKAPLAPRSADAGGVRAAISASDVRRGLEALANRPGVQVVRYYRAGDSTK